MTSLSPSACGLSRRSCPPPLSQNPKYDRAWADGKNENYNTVRIDWDISTLSMSSRRLIRSC